MRLFQRAARTRDDTSLARPVRALQDPGGSFEILPTADEDKPWAVIMDSGIADGTITVVPLGDGSASVSMSRGGSSIGVRSSDAIRAAALSAISPVSEVQQEMQPAAECPLPEVDNIAFDAKTDAEIVSQRISVEEVGSGNHLPIKVGNAMQLVITRYRKLES